MENIGKHCHMLEYIGINWNISVCIKLPYKTLYADLNLHVCCVTLEINTMCMYMGVVCNILQSSCTCVMIYMDVYKCVCVPKYLPMFLCMCVYMWVSASLVCPYPFVHMYTYVCVCINVSLSLSLGVSQSLCTCVCMLGCMHVNGPMSPYYLPISSHTCVHASVHVCEHNFISWCGQIPLSICAHALSIYENVPMSMV